MDMLVALGTSAAYGLSVHLMLRGGSDLYFESAAVIVVLVRLGKWLEARAKRRTLKALEALESLRPSEALVRRDGGDEVVPVTALRHGDLLVVKPGDRIAADGVVVEGRSSVDQSLLTGESKPVEVERDDHVIGGAVNGEGLLLVEDGRRLVPGHRLRDEIRVAHVADLQRPPLNRLPMAGREVVQRDWGKAGSMQGLAHVAADIAGAAGHQDGRLLGHGKSFPLCLTSPERRGGPLLWRPPDLSPHLVAICAAAHAATRTVSDSSMPRGLPKRQRAKPPLGGNCCRTARALRFSAVTSHAGNFSTGQKLVSAREAEGQRGVIRAAMHTGLSRVSHRFVGVLECALE